MKMLGGDEVDKQCRKPEIMADAAYVMLTKDSRNYTGNFAIDDEVLRDVGVTELDQYAVDPSECWLSRECNYELWRTCSDVFDN